MSTSGGQQETDVKELAVRPYGVPSLPDTVQTVMPVANREQARRKLTGSIMETGAVIGLDKLVTSILS